MKAIRVLRPSVGADFAVCRLTGRYVFMFKYRCRFVLKIMAVLSDLKLLSRGEPWGIVHQVKIFTGILSMDS